MYLPRSGPLLRAARPYIGSPALVMTIEIKTNNESNNRCLIRRSDSIKHPSSLLRGRGLFTFDRLERGVRDETPNKAGRFYLNRLAPDHVKAGEEEDQVWTICDLDDPMIVRFNSHRELKRRQQREIRSVSSSAASVEGGAGWRIVMMKSIRSGSTSP